MYGRFFLLGCEVGSGMVGTYCVGLLMLRPDFVTLGRGVYEAEMSLALPSSGSDFEESVSWRSLSWMMVQYACLDL